MFSSHSLRMWSYIGASSQTLQTLRRLIGQLIYLIGDFAGFVFGREDGPFVSNTLGGAPSQ